MVWALSLHPTPDSTFEPHLADSLRDDQRTASKSSTSFTVFPPTETTPLRASGALTIGGPTFRLAVF